MNSIINHENPSSDSTPGPRNNQRCPSLNTMIHSLKGPVAALICVLALAIISVSVTGVVLALVLGCDIYFLIIALVIPVLLFLIPLIITYRKLRSPASTTDTPQDAPPTSVSPIPRTPSPPPASATPSADTPLTSPSSASDLGLDISHFQDVFLPAPNGGRYFNDPDLGLIYIPPEDDDSDQASPPSQPDVSLDIPPGGGLPAPTAQVRPSTSVVGSPQSLPQTPEELEAHIQQTLGETQWRLQSVDSMRGVHGTRKCSATSRIVHLSLGGCNYDSIPRRCNWRNVDASATLTQCLVASHGVVGVEGYFPNNPDFILTRNHPNITGLIITRDETALVGNHSGDPHINDPYQSSMIDPLLKQEIFEQHGFDDQLTPGTIRNYIIPPGPRPLIEVRKYPELGSCQLLDVMIAHEPSVCQSYHTLYTMYKQALKLLQPCISQLVVIIPSLDLSETERDNLKPVLSEEQITTIEDSVPQAAFLNALSDCDRERNRPLPVPRIHLILNAFRKFAI